MHRIALMLAVVLALLTPVAFSEMGVQFIGEIEEPTVDNDTEYDSEAISSDEAMSPDEPEGAIQPVIVGTDEAPAGDDTGLGLETAAQGSDAETAPAGLAVQEEADSAICLDGLMEITVEKVEALDAYGAYEADSRNRYAVIPAHVLNISHGDINVLGIMQAELHYQSYSFEPLDIEAADSIADSPVGEWKVYESVLGERVQTFDVSIKSIDASGRMDIEWGSYRPDNAIWHGEQSYFVLDNTQTFAYLNGQIAGGGGKYRSVGVRKQASITSRERAATLSMLEEATYQIIFRVPNVVCEHLSECVAVISIGDERFSMKLGTA